MVVVLYRQVTFTKQVWDPVTETPRVRRGENKNAYWILVGKSERKRPLGKPRRICEDNIKTDLNMERRAWTGLIWLRILTGGGLLCMR